MSTHPRAVAGRAILASLLFGSLLVAAACNDPHPARYAFSSAAMTRIQNFVGVELQWHTWNVFEFNDEQSLDYGGNYGPVAMMFANPNLATLTQADYRDTGIIAAVVFIDPESDDIPKGYAKLGIKPDFTCVIMKWTDANAWEAYSVQSDQRTCRTNDERVPLSVKVLTPFTNASDYAPVARFEITQKRHNVLAVRCLVGWCLLGTEDADPVEAPEHLADAAGDRTPQQKLSAWHDYQRVSIRKWSADWEWWPVAKRLKPVMKASLIPQPGLGERLEDYFKQDTGQLVAQVFIKGSVESKYANMGMRKGWTNVHLRLNTATNRWAARFIAGRDTSVWYSVERKDHHADLPAGVRIPGVTRWRWDKDDEEIWVACDVGCCRVTRDPE